MKAPSWFPRFTLTPAIARGLMQIEAARALVEHTPLPPAAEAELRAHARVRAVHYSTFIEGNRLTMSQAKRQSPTPICKSLAGKGMSPR